MNPEWRPGHSSYRRVLPVYSTDQPEVHDIVAMMRRVMDEYDDRVMIGEIYLPIDRLVTYYGHEGRGAHLPFNFMLIEHAWDARRLNALINEYEGQLPEEGWPNWVLGNHDKSRIATRVGIEQARVASLLLLTLRGTPTMYYGDEIGMRDVEIPARRVHDPQEINQPGLGLGRDPERTPMQWDGSAHAGFSAVEPWLPVANDATEVNVEAQRDDPTSMLALHRRLLLLRRREPALSIGAFKPVPTEGDVIAYLRTDQRRQYFIALNLGHEEQRHALHELRGMIVLNTHLDREGEDSAGSITLRPDEAVIIQLNAETAPSNSD